LPANTLKGLTGAKSLMHEPMWDRNGEKHGKGKGLHVCVCAAKRVFQKLIVGPSPSEKPQGAKAEAGDISSIVDAGRQNHGALQPGEARATFEIPSKL